MITKGFHKIYIPLRGGCHPVSKHLRRINDLINPLGGSTTPSELWVDVLCPVYTLSSKASGYSRMALRLITIIAILILPLAASAQDYTQTIKRSAVFENAGANDNKLSICNIHGSVSVEGYKGEEILITATRQINGNVQEVELAKEELSLRVEQEGKLVLIYIDAPFITLSRKDDRIRYRMDSWDDDYKFLFEITVRVPKHTQIYASTINRGSVVIENTTQQVSASNVNGRIELRNISGATKAHTVNGDITATYSDSPDADSEYQTVNGTIEVKYPKTLSADIRFKSMHGDLYTDFSNTKRLRAQVSKDINSKRGKTTYRLDRFTPIRIGAGGPTYSFEVLNGNVYVKQIKS